ncbi:hypothetical protein MSG28_006507 [Choristoneura fumiferana]|uniref:Uncharacterized protein n=1 Tax=Choristoneura fumiferana TaxID=7141 RepID=A0ACC0JFB4_CHOFU|nr:hypothetical protein MSG28_006507 [Choristoneura fumiferana]
MSVKMLNKRVWGLAICLFVVAVAVNVTASSDQKGDSPSKSKFTTPYLIGALVVAAVLAVVINLDWGFSKYVDK